MSSEKTGADRTQPSLEWQAGYAAAMRDAIEAIKRRMPRGLPRDNLFDDLLAIGIGRAP